VKKDRDGQEDPATSQEWDGQNDFKEPVGRWSDPNEDAQPGQK
jgi:hypothetical protein